MDTYLHVFNHDLQDVFSMDFKFNIDVLEWTKHPNFLLLGLSNGQAQLVHVPSKTPLPPIQVGPADCQGFSGLQDFRFLPRDFFGTKLISLKVQDLQGLDSALQSQDYASLKAFHDEVKIETLDLSTPCCTLNQEFVTLNAALSILEDNKLRHTLNLDSNVVKVLVPKQSNDLVVFVLDSKGTIHVICIVTMITLFQFSTLEVIDMILIEDTDTCPQLMMIGTNDCQDYFLQIRQYPDFEQCLYSLKVSPYCRLLDTCLDQENPMFIEGTFEEEANDENIDTLNNDQEDNKSGTSKGSIKMLRIRAICEGHPDARLHRLLNRKKFEEATKFALLNKLDLEEIYRSKCIALMSDLSAWTTTDKKTISHKDDVILDELEECLKLIKDLSFVVKFCLNATFKDLEKIRRLLKLARQCIQNSSQGMELDINLMVDVSRALQRLDTFIFINGIDHGNVEEWLEFLNANMFSQLKLSLQQGDVHAAIILWTRHQSDVEWNQEMIRTLLETMPSKVESLEFLPKFISESILKMRDQAAVASTVEIFSAWIVSSTKALESKKKMLAWPQSGLEFAQSLLEALYVADKDDKGLSSARIPLLLQKHKSSPDTSLHKLIKLLDTLQDLAKLHNQFKIKVSHSVCTQEHNVPNKRVIHASFSQMKLDEFEREDKSEVAICLLDWCYDELEISRLLKDFLLDYLKKFKYDTNQVLSKYLLYLLDQSSFSWYWNQGEPAPWENSVSTLLNYITDDSLKLDLILAILRQAPVPWSNQIKSISAEGCALKDPRSSLLVKEEQLVVVKEMVTKYQAGKSFNRKGREAERLLQRIFQTSTDHETFQDALRVAQVMDGVGVKDAKLLYVEKLIQLEKVNEAIDVLKGDDDCQFVVEMVLIRAERRTTLHLVLFLKLATLVYHRQLDHLESRIKIVSDKQSFNDLLEDDESIQEYISHCANEQSVQVALAKIHKIHYLSKVDYSTLIRDYTRALHASNLHENIRHVLKHLIEDRVPVDLEDLELDSLRYVKEEFFLIRNRINDDDAILEDAGAFTFKAKWMYFVHLLCQCSSDKSYFCDQALVDDNEEEENDDMTSIKKKLKANQFWDKGLPIDASVIAKTISLFKQLCLVTEAQPRETIDDLDITVPEDQKFDQPKSVAVVAEKVHEDIFNAIEEILDELLEKNYVMLALQFLKLLEWPLITYNKAKDFLNGKRANLITSFLTHVLMERMPDLPLALAMLQGECQVQDGLKKLSQLMNLGSNAKLVNLARLGSRYCSRLKLRGQKEQFLNLLMSTLWSNELNIKGTTLASLEQGNPEHLQLLSSSYLLKDFLKDDHIIGNLLQYAKAFGLATSTLMECLIKAKLKSTKGIRNSMLDQALHHIPREQQESLVEELIQLASPYDYDLLEHLFEILQDGRNCQMLTYLRAYQRVTSPSEAEIDEWVDARSTPFPMLEAKKGLPFHPLWRVANNPKEMFKLVQDEFNVDTYQGWLTVCKLFKLGAISVRVFAVQNTVSQLLDQYSTYDDHQQWYTQSIIPVTSMNKIVECLEGIPDFYKANCAIHSISKKLPKGNEKLRLARLGLEFATQLDQEKQDDSSAQTLNFAHQAAIKLEIESILYHNNLYDAKYLDIVQHMNLTDLIMNLYEDPSVLEQNPKVNKAAREITHVVQDPEVVNLTLLRWKLLDQWLPDAADGQDDQRQLFDETINNFNILKDAMSKQEEKGIDTSNTQYWRCVYVLQGFIECQEVEGSQYLFHVIFSSEPKWTPDQKLRALKCLLSVMGSETLEETLGKPMLELEQRFQSLVLMSQLQTLNMPYHSVEAIDNCDKMALVESILRNCGHMENAIILIVDLCTFHQIFHSTLWSKILAKLQNAKKYPNVLKSALKAINGQPHLWHLPEFRKCWQELILRPLSQITHQLSREESIEICRRSLGLLQGCPVATDIEVKPLRDICAKLDLTWTLP